MTVQRFQCINCGSQHNVKGIAVFVITVTDPEGKLLHFWTIDNEAVTHQVAAGTLNGFPAPPTDTAKSHYNIGTKWRCVLLAAGAVLPVWETERVE